MSILRGIKSRDFNFLPSGNNNAVTAHYFCLICIKLLPTVNFAVIMFKPHYNERKKLRKAVKK